MTVTTGYLPAGDNAFNDPVWGAGEAKKQLAQGADIIFGAGGNTGNGALQEVAKAKGLEDGFRVISNKGVNAGQTVMHFHMHVLGGKNLGENLI